MKESKTEYFVEPVIPYKEISRQELALLMPELK